MSHAHTSHQPHLPSSHSGRTQRPAVEDTALQGFLPGPTFHIRLTSTTEGGVAQCPVEQLYFLHTSAVVIPLTPSSSQGDLHLTQLTANAFCTHTTNKQMLSSPSRFHSLTGVRNGGTALTTTTIFLYSVGSKLRTGSTSQVLDSRGSF